MLITIRNPNEARARTVRAATALENGTFVKVQQGQAQGEVLDVSLVSTLPGANDVYGIVFSVREDDEAVDYIYDPVTRQLTLNTGDDNTYKIASGELCTLWTSRPVVGFTKDAVHANMAAAWDTLREGGLVAVNLSNGKLDEYDAADTGVTDSVVGVIHLHEGGEITVDFTKIS